MNKISALNKIAIERSNAPQPQADPPPAETRERANPLNTQRSSWAVWLIVSLAVFILLGLNLKLFFMMKDYPLEMKIIHVKLNEVTEMLSNYEQRNLDLIAQIKQLGLGLEKANAQISETGSRITKLETVNDGNKAVLENLTKAKDTLFTKFSSLESELETLKSANAKTVE
jgi:septal ring factor EnvC (AmiA/AmiB activator)